MRFTRNIGLNETEALLCLTAEEKQNYRIDVVLPPFTACYSRKTGLKEIEALLSLIAEEA